MWTCLLSPGCGTEYNLSWRKGIAVITPLTWEGLMSSAPSKVPDWALRWKRRGVKLNLPGSERNTRHRASLVKNGCKHSLHDRESSHMVYHSLLNITPCSMQSYDFLSCGPIAFQNSAGSFPSSTSWTFIKLPVLRLSSGGHLTITINHMKSITIIHPVSWIDTFYIMLKVWLTSVWGVGWSAWPPDVLCCGLCSHATGRSPPAGCSARPMSHETSDWSRSMGPLTDCPLQTHHPSHRTDASLLKHIPNLYCQM